MEGLNLYAYAPNPISWIDSWGWISCKLKNPPKKNAPAQSELDAMTKKINEILTGNPQPRPRIFNGKLNS